MESMVKGITGLVNGIIIYADPNNQSDVEIGFIFKINPLQNLAMMSDADIERSFEDMLSFLTVNTYTFSIIKRKAEVTDYDYLDNYKSILEKKNIKGQDNELHKNMLQGTARMIQKFTKGAKKHEYFLKINTPISNTKTDKEILEKQKNIKYIVDNFPREFRVEKMLNSKEVLIQLLKENRFFTSELNTLENTDLAKAGYYTDLLNI